MHQQFEFDKAILRKIAVPQKRCMRISCAYHFDIVAAVKYEVRGQSPYADSGFSTKGGCSISEFCFSDISRAAKNRNST